MTFEDLVYPLLFGGVTVLFVGAFIIRAYSLTPPRWLQVLAWIVFALWAFMWLSDETPSGSRVFVVWLIVLIVQYALVYALLSLCYALIASITGFDPLGTLRL